MDVTIDKIKKSIDILSGKLDESKKEEISEETIFAYEIAIDTMSKEIPKIVEIKDWSPAYCPRCGLELSTHVGDGWYRHPKHIVRCPNIECTQRLQWPKDI